MEYQLPTREAHASNNPTEDYKVHHAQSYDQRAHSTDLAQLGADFRILPVPTETDDLEATYMKLEELARVVKQGNSLALFTGLKLATQKTRDPETVAKAHLSPQELQMYQAWKEMRAIQETLEDGGKIKYDQDSQLVMRLPEFDWEENVAPVPQGAQSLKKFTQRAEAMDIIFDHQGATPEHASWLTSNMAIVLPLVKAVTKVSNIGKHMENMNNDRHTRGLTDMEAAEVETVRKLVAIAGKNTNREMEKIHRWTRSIKESMMVIKARADALETERL
ncbi:hypothetical protein BO94DRAFT_533510 [Aspergillus sclerotioniger CBS 115572]|uniref:Uncharacterized protein n=1 Tax=Aspergillus sclerotioniger CBS 115572 TaxID=1450535 RepID=A0A317WY81_9EURO|nr:hypothetical protein BO94DRAFT_533510 [Aspergillus sclerotioniger CBS 115572]PWY91376.1 hypothetical protein BO94DRAFT_533510 [Aspergillus sclerotioniger CBS 115572]